MVSKQDLKSGAIGAFSCLCTLLCMQGFRPKISTQLHQCTAIRLVFTATKDIPAGTVFTADMMQGQVMEARKIPAGIIWRQVLVVGRKTQFDFKKGMFIGISDFVDFQDHKTMHPED